MDYYNNLIEKMNAATSGDIRNGKNWYLRAHHFCKEVGRKYGIPTYKIAAILAATSVNKGWEQNKQIVIDFCKTGKIAHFSFIKEKVRDIMDGRDPVTVLNGEKITNFYLNILHPDWSGPVTIDRHAYRAAGIPEKATPKRYRDAKAAYNKLAHTYGMLPNQVQAIVWEVQRSGR